MTRAAIALLAAVVLAACGQMPAPPGDPQLPPAPKMVEVEDAATGTALRVARGGEVKIMLDSNPTTGFQWQGPREIAPTLSPIGTRAWVGKGADPRFLGAGGVDIFRYKAEQPGKVTMVFEYRRPWETVPAAKTMKYEVTVE